MSINKNIATMKKSAGLICMMIGLFFSSGLIESAMAQRSNYERLAFQNNQPNIYVDVITLPGETGDKLKLTAIFQLSNNFMPFRKKRDQTGTQTFMSSAELNFEVFRSPEKRLKPREQVDIEGLESVGRATWRDTAYVANYEQTQTNDIGLQGSMQVDVTPGNYTYLMQLNQENQTKTRNSRTQNIHVAPLDEQRDNVILVQNVDSEQNPSRLQLLNMGNRVTYGKDFYAFIHLPDYDENTTYNLQINRVKPTRKDTTQVDQVLDQEITSSQILQNVQPTLQYNADAVNLALNTENGTYNYALIKIPNSTFVNAAYRLKITSDQSPRPITQSFFQSHWSDIPTSLLSLDIAIDMLHYITDEETIDRIDDGSDSARERKFREFWKAKDPTPDTEFNELQSEYYKRIDYAYDNFTSQNELGFDSDRGKIYINYGPPNNIERTFPTNDATTEVWQYEGRQFVFKATTGFGDFKLVSK